MTTDVGVFDSGIGGISVLRELDALVHHARMTYVADSRYVPYGTKPPDLIRARAVAITRLLVDEQRAAVVVVACNTATTHAVDLLREQFKDVPIVGVEPAIKPAARVTRSGVVGVLATGATLVGARVSNLIERHSEGIDVITQPCPGLVEQVEAGDLSGPRTIALLRQYSEPLLARGADTIVLGCTHYPFLKEALSRIVGPSVTLIDSGEAVARQAARVLGARRPEADRTGHDGSTDVAFFTSGDPRAIRPVLERLWGRRVSEIRPLDV
jgi:glutamate racemase